MKVRSPGAGSQSMMARELGRKALFTPWSPCYELHTFKDMLQFKKESTTGFYSSRQLAQTAETWIQGVSGPEKESTERITRNA